MGKWKERRRYGSRYNPSQANGRNIETENNGENLEFLTSNGELDSTGGLKAVEEKIGSNVVEERIFALNSLAGMALEKGAPEILVKTKLLSIVVKLLGDESIQVRLSAVGALRNICAGGSDEVVEGVVQLGILVPLSHLLTDCNNHCQTPPGGDITTSSKIPSTDELILNPDLCWNQILINSVNLLWNLCECCDVAIDEFNSKNLIQIMTKYLDPCWGQALSMACADCLLCVTEDNEGLGSEKEVMFVKVKSLISQSLAAAQYKYSITLSGILVNISDSLRQDNMVVIETIAGVLGYNILAELQSSTPNVNKLADILSAQQLALEIFSNCCCSDDTDELSNHSSIWENVTGDEAEAEGMEEENDEQMEVSSPDTFNIQVSVEMEESIKKFDLLNKVISKISVLSKEELEVLDKIDAEKKGEIMSKFLTLRMRALVCLQNLIVSTDVETLGGTALLLNLWNSLGNLLVSIDQSDLQLLEAATGALRATIEKTSNSQNMEHLFKITIDELKSLCNIGLTCTTPLVRGNITRTIGTLGCMFVKYHKADELVNMEQSVGTITSGITYYLIKVAEEDKELWVCAEALDSTIDMFSDDKTDKLALHIGLVERLKSIKASFILQYRNKGKRVGEQNALISTVKDNLQPFIKYKQTRLNKLKKK